jgi:hypothetical protein
LDLFLLMRLKNLLKFLTFEYYLQLLVLAIPALLITGPFLPDLFLVLISIIICYVFGVKKRIKFSKP